jgi:hypothetical protein
MTELKEVGRNQLLSLELQPPPTFRWSPGDESSYEKNADMTKEGVELSATSVQFGDSADEPQRCGQGRDQVANGDGLNLVPQWGP